MPRASLNFEPLLSHSASFKESQAKVWEGSRSPSPRKAQSQPAPFDTDKDGSNLKESGLPWYEKHAPLVMSDVAIHQRKLKDVETVLQDMLSSGCEGTRLLLLTGPSGSSKSTIAKVLANRLVRNERELLCAATKSEFALNKRAIVEYENSLSLTDLGQMSQFKEFLKSCKYCVGPSNLSVILVEDLPNVFHAETRRLFQRAIEEWLYSPDTRLPPLVICLTECEIETDSNAMNQQNFSVDTSFTAQTVFTSHILNHPRLKQIKFNPINKTLMRRTLGNICMRERDTLQRNGKWAYRNKYIGKLAEEMGDLRAAIATLEFWCGTKSNRIDLIPKKKSVSYFHAIGKVIHGSQDTVDDEVMVTELIDTTRGTVSNDTFKLGLLENYSSHNSGELSLRSALDISNALSLSDCMRSTPESLEYSIRKVRGTLRRARDTGRRHSTLTFPREWKYVRNMKLFRIESDDYINVSFYKYGRPVLYKDIVAELGYYGPLIRKQQSYKKKSMMCYVDSLPPTQRDAVLLKSKSICQVDDAVDVTGRLGGDIRVVGAEAKTEYEMSSVDDHELSLERSVAKLMMAKQGKLRRLTSGRASESPDTAEGAGSQGADAGDGDGDEVRNDVLVDSDEEIADKSLSNAGVIEGDDDEDDSLLEMLSKQKGSSMAHPSVGPQPRDDVKKDLPTSRDISALFSDSDLEELADKGIL
ncbi:Rad24p KNAG_0G01910 [Huiozyma naganishii CBS 8797]|uniref:Checkpoint protein RAD24-like helical bundle domain-containing protein n=1 Tax=Huiozyma naganishii (strain ATCC MYA-139 / BCRC 22969 / CBS 8797 / KCTC 17520 / NBRC 10181 / NCYC 3082 / Yp74L-3) TaxID=1071383 RepID=J7RNS8_HUIN7|nr:hypothetical protein KNAG_0G01910 [Kazachstania naganishii CBS 8797]CCK71248.1 hypothetical protein KNAG_0G01910 [Kazachstania naganishii CBS 8797]